MLTARFNNAVIRITIFGILKNPGTLCTVNYSVTIFLKHFDVVGIPN